jgi:hypothetical protein
MSTSNHSWNAGDRPALYVTPAGIELLAYLDYVTVHNFASLAPGDTRIPPDEQPEDPGEQQWDDMPKAHTQTPEETAWAIRQLMDAGATFPNFQNVPPDPPAPIAPPERLDEERQPPERRDVTPHVDDSDFDLTDDDDDEYGAHSPEED